MYEQRGYGYRQKRNSYDSGSIEDTSHRSTRAGIHWPDENTACTKELSSNIEYHEPNEIDVRHTLLQPIAESIESCTIKGMTPLIAHIRPNLTPQPIGQKLTIYLSPETIRSIKELKRERRIKSLSQLVSDSIQHYLVANDVESSNNK